MKRLLLVCALAVLGAPAAAQADAVIDWNVDAQAAILATEPTAHASMLSFAMVHGAVYDAVNAIDGGYQPYLRRAGGPATRRTPQPRPQPSACSWPRTRRRRRPCRRDTTRRWPRSRTGARRTRGIAAGEAAAAAMLAARENDGRLRRDAVSVPARHDARRLAAVAAADRALTRPVGRQREAVPGPERGDVPHRRPEPALRQAYAKDFDEVKALGSLTSTRRTADQTMAAIFWQAQPGALYGGVMRVALRAARTGHCRRTRACSGWSLAAADAAIGCWNDKYYWKVLAADRRDPRAPTPTATRRTRQTRPGCRCSTRRRRPRRRWPRRISRPPVRAQLHQQRDSARPGGLLRHGQDRVRRHSPRFPGQPSHFDRFSNVLQEIIDARVWGGIHFRTADEQGAARQEGRSLGARFYFGAWNSCCSQGVPRRYVSFRSLRGRPCQPLPCISLTLVDARSRAR